MECSTKGRANGERAHDIGKEVEVHAKKDGPGTGRGESEETNRRSFDMKTGLMLLAGVMGQGKEQRR
jgi:hypothetical protein